MFSACGIWCLADVSSVNPPSEQTISFWCVYLAAHLIRRLVGGENKQENLVMWFDYLTVNRATIYSQFILMLCIQIWTH